MSPILLLGFSWNKLFWIFPLDHAEIRPKSYLRRKARPSATSPLQFLLQHYSRGRRTKCSVDSDKEKQRWSLVTPNDKLLLAPPIFFCATVDAKVTEGLSAVFEFYCKMHGEITCLVTQECQVAWPTAHEISESPLWSALVTRLERPFVWKWSHLCCYGAQEHADRVVGLRTGTFPDQVGRRPVKWWWNHILYDVRNLSCSSRDKCVQPVLLACQSTQRDRASRFCRASTWKQGTFTFGLCSGLQEVSVKDE